MKRYCLSDLVCPLSGKPLQLIAIEERPLDLLEHSFFKLLPTKVKSGIFWIDLWVYGETFAPIQTKPVLEIHSQLLLLRIFWTRTLSDSVRSLTLAQ